MDLSLVTEKLAPRSPVCFGGETFVHQLISGPGDGSFARSASFT